MIVDPEQLEKLGFLRNEAKIYLLLLEEGPLLAGALSKKSGINRRTTYDTIERLLQKGYLTYSISANRKVLSAINPKIILEKIEENKKEAEFLLPQLINIFDAKSKKQSSQIYVGRKGIRTILNEMLKVKEYVGFGSNEKFPEIMGHDFLIFQKRKKELGIRSKTLMSSFMRNKPILKEAHTKYRFLPEKFSLPTSTFIYGDKVAIIIWSENPTAMLIENKEVSLSFLQYFNSLWSIAKE